MLLPAVALLFQIQAIRLPDLPQGQVTVVTFVSSQCAVSNQYTERMSALYNGYGSKGVKFFFVDSNRNEPDPEVADWAKSIGLPFPIYKDGTGELAVRFGAQVTPESFVVDRQGAVVYRGPIDDSRNEARVGRRYVREALDAVLAGRPVLTTQAKAFGCTIKLAK